MTIFNVGGGGGSGGLTFKDMTTGLYEIKESDWGNYFTKVENYMFYYDKLLQKITIPNGYTSIDSNAFYECNKLEDITLPNSITTIASSAFSGCKKLKSIDLSKINSIGSYSFNNCWELQDVTFSDNVTTLGPNTFFQCYAFKNITIPKNIVNIGSNTFSGCSAVEKLTIDNTGSQMTFQSSAFSNLGRNSGVIIELLGTTPPTIQSSTFNNANIIKIIVPQGSLTAYQTATNWSAYAQYMEEAA